MCSVFCLSLHRVYTFLCFIAIFLEWMMISPGVWDGYLTEDKKRVSFVARVKSNNGYFTCSGVVGYRSLSLLLWMWFTLDGLTQDAKERQFVVSGRVKSVPPFAFTGGMNFVQNKEQMKQINGWREVGTGGLFGEWSQRGVVGGTFSMQPTIPKEQREFLSLLCALSLLVTDVCGLTAFVERRLVDFEKEDCRGVLHQMGCDQNMIDDILSVTTDTQVAARMALAKLGKGQSGSGEGTHVSPSPGSTTLNIWRLSELGFPEELAFNALMASVCDSSFFLCTCSLFMMIVSHRTATWKWLVSC